MIIWKWLLAQENFPYVSPLKVKLWVPSIDQQDLVFALLVSCLALAQPSLVVLCPTPPFWNGFIYIGYIGILVYWEDVIWFFGFLFVCFLKGGHG